ncbi:MAG: helicase-exonuclease AddAB subunit AddB [Bacillota bacterium]|jgi:ATP-dependent helicase/nuclease subunit B
MGLRFILGRAGTGKTRFCLEEIRYSLRQDPKEGPPLIFLVPEQASFQTEMALIAAPDLTGTIRAKVLSFRRLGWLIFQETGGGHRRYLDELGKMMAIRSLLLQKSKELLLFDKIAQETGFIHKLAKTLAEFKQYNILPDTLFEYYQGLVRETGDQSALGYKIHDLHLIYQAYEDFLSGRYLDPDDYLHLLSRKILVCSFLQGARVWIDGFSAFTPREMEVIGALLCQCRQVNLALCLDSRQLQGKCRETDLFHPTRETYEQFLDLAARLRVPVEDTICLDRPGSLAFRFLANPALGYLEKNFENPSSPWQGEIQGLQLVAAANRRVEAEGVAREILRLVRDEGYRYRDLAVILRNLDDYADLLAAVFTDYGIPYFMDRKRPVHHHPLIELVKAALETVSGSWHYESVFRYLKTDLVPVSRAEVDLLENYVLANGIGGRHWLEAEPWTFPRQYSWEEDREATLQDTVYLEKIHRARVRASSDLISFHRQVTGRKKLTVREMTVALYGLLEDLGVPRRLEGWRRKAVKQGMLDEGEEHLQVWNGLMQVLDQLVEALGDQILTIGQYARVLESGLETLQLGLIPQALDQVLVGSIERSRQPEIKGAFLLGVNEGSFPARLSEDEIFTDGEREKLAGSRLELAPTSKMRLLHEEYLAYIALTRAAHYLWVSYPLAGEEGKSLLPSPLIGRLRLLFPNMSLRFLAVEPEKSSFPLLHYLTDPGRVLSFTACQLQKARKGREFSPLVLELYRWLLDHREQVPGLALFLRAPFYRNETERLSEDLVEKLYGNSLRSSVSRLETFASCPFRYFAQYGLGLEERRIFRLDARAAGLFYHQFFKEFTEELQSRGLDWGKLRDEELEGLVAEIVERMIPRLQNEILLNSPRYRYLTGVLRETLLTATKVLTEHARRGMFRPVAVELAFGLEKGLPPWEISLKGGRRLQLRGRIDRLDLARKEGSLYLRVIDYKSSDRDLELTKLYHGLDLQLLTYLAVALAYGRRWGVDKVEPGGVFYFPVQQPLLREDGPLAPEEAAAKIKKKLKMRGIVLDDPHVIGLMGGAKSSDLIPASLNRDGSLSKRSKALSRENWTLLQEFLRRRLARLSEEIFSGVTDIAPYRLGTETPCSHCSFTPFCCFDILLEGCRYRDLAKEKDEVIMERIRQEMKEGEA